jgi:hypothetical protein
MAIGGERDDCRCAGRFGNLRDIGPRNINYSFSFLFPEHFDPLPPPRLQSAPFHRPTRAPSATATLTATSPST